MVSSFVNKFASLNNASSMLILSHTEFKVFTEESFITSNKLVQKYPMFPNAGLWDIVLGDFPMGMRTAAPLKSELRSYNAAAIEKSLEYIQPNGFGIFSVEPSLVISEKNSIRRIIDGSGFSIIAILNTPKDFLKPYTSLSPYLIVVKNVKGLDTEFVAELELPDQAEVLAENILNNKSSTNLTQGLWLQSNSFLGFTKWKVKQQIRLLDTEYKGFNAKKISDIAISINACKQGASFKDIENAIYIPKIGIMKVCSDISKLTKKHQNYFQIECDNQIVNPCYLESFFDSKLGQLSLSSILSQNFIPNITKSDLLDLDISLPSLQVQDEIVNSIAKLSAIREKISAFTENLAINPISSNYALKQIDAMLSVAGELADDDRIKSIIRTGESKTVEFKESLSLDVTKQTKEKYIEDSAIKTIAAFLNTDGGFLLIGVDDSSHVKGLDDELAKFYKDSKDNFLLHFKNLLKTRIGEQFYPFIDHEIVMVNSKLILCVNCKSSGTEVYVDDKDFYVRTNPATDKLEGPKLVAYINHHFKR